MARHDQRVPVTKWTCVSCRKLECETCVDRIRARVSMREVSRLCVCEHELEDAMEIGKVREELDADYQATRNKVQSQFNAAGIGDLGPNA